MKSVDGKRATSGHEKRLLDRWNQKLSRDGGRSLPPVALSFGLTRDGRSSLGSFFSLITREPKGATGWSDRGEE